MKLVFLRSAAPDIDWFLSYYHGAFPQGLENAKEGYRRTKKLLAENPYAGHPSYDEVEVREFPVLNTPFLFVYRVTSRQIEVLRVWDQRSKRPSRWLKASGD